MPQVKVRARFYLAFDPHVWLVGIAALAVIGCRTASPTTPRFDQSSAATRTAVKNVGLLERIGVPVGIAGYRNPVFSGNSRRFLAIDGRQRGNETVRVWDVATLQPLCDPLPDTGPDEGLTFDGKIAFTTDDHTVRFWNVDTSKPICVTKVTNGRLHDAAISNDGAQFLTFAEGEQAVEVWHTGDTRPRVLLQSGLPLRAAFDPTGTRVAVFSGISTHIFSAETGKETCPPIRCGTFNLPDLSTSFDSTGRSFLVKEYNGFEVVDTTTGKMRFYVGFEALWGSVNDNQFVRWSSDSSKIVAMAFAYPHPARVYDPATGKLERTFGTDVSNCWVGPGAHWAMGSGGSFTNESFDVWNVDTGQRVQTLDFLDALVSPDCSTILTMREDGLDAIWRMQQD